MTRKSPIILPDGVSAPDSVSAPNVVSAAKDAKQSGWRDHPIAIATATAVATATSVILIFNQVVLPTQTADLRNQIATLTKEIEDHKRNKETANERVRSLGKL